MLLNLKKKTRKQINARPSAQLSSKIKKKKSLENTTRNIDGRCIAKMFLMFLSLRLFF